MSSTFNGRQMHTQSWFIARAGSWRHDCVLTEGKRPEKGSLATIVSGGLTLTGSVLRSEDDAVDRPHVVTVGGLGWHQNVKSPLSFQCDTGVRLRAVLTALSNASGEKLEMPPDRTIGEYFECMSATPEAPITYADVLNGLVRDGALAPWRVDIDNVTRFGERAATAITDRATKMRANEGVGAITYGIDDPRQFIPPNTVDGRTLDRVHVTEISGKFTAQVFTESAPEPIDEQIRKTIAREFSDRIRTYIVRDCHEDGRCDLVAPSDAPHYPEMRNVEQWSLGAVAFRASKGDEVIVAFRDWKRTRPIIIGAKLIPGPYADIAPKGANVDVLLPPMVFTGTIGGAPATGVLASPLVKTLGSVTIGSTKAGVKL